MAEWWRGAVVYQIYPRSFQDSNGDGIGDLVGITRRLEHVARLGADAIWISPVFPSPMADMGYDVSDYRGIEPLFGTLADFDALLARAHDLGLRVILDQVLSHSSDRHPWFADSRTRGARADWYVWADARADGTPPNNWLSVFGGPAWEWDAGRRQYYLHNFLPSQPDLNLHNPAAQDAVLEVLRFWLDRGVDGFRLDTVNYYLHDPALRNNPPAPGGLAKVNTYDMQDHRYDKTRPENLALIARIRALTDAYPDRCLIGEVGEVAGRALPVMAAYTKGKKHLHMAYSFDLLGEDYTPAHFRETVEGFLAAAPDGWPYWSFSNHDVVRAATRWAGNGADPELVAKQALALLLSLPGTIGLYQGEELGQTETELAYEELTDPLGLRFWPEVKGRDGCRTPMVWDTAPQAGFSTARPWLPVKPPQALRNVVAAEAQPASVLHHARAVLALRRASPALQLGATRFLDLPAPILGFTRSKADTSLTCLFNLSPVARRLAVPTPGTLIAPSQGAEQLGSELLLSANAWAWQRH
ncbi:MAG: alpha-amylase family glycosyl hydrolase [Phaeovulum sp.]|uniref:alpha-amylase family glycosyl hydrolase n=1 Tax=Phaeovulum sp. TaxID=2934796 RepID=UPI002734BBCA|nr:alpha-amylase family glycosyl hydrolase [Phaeovulum sp.]MDP3861860.1 alpha-amylase family glycosyl hydrolase [Phaeovulum sp.]